MVSTDVRFSALESMRFIISFVFSFYITEDDFLDNTTFLYKIWYLMMSTSIVRFKYYHAWLLADAICNNSGLGFNGYENDGNPKWDLITNINVIGFEVGSLKIMSNCHNCTILIDPYKLGQFSWRPIYVMQSTTGTWEQTNGYV